MTSIISEFSSWLLFPARMNSEDWTRLFFSQNPPDWINVSPEDQKNFRTFHHKRKWVPWKSVDKGRYAAADRIQVLWLLVKYHQGYRRMYVAKVVSHSAEASFQCFRLKANIQFSSRNILKHKLELSSVEFLSHAIQSRSGMNSTPFSTKLEYSVALKSVVIAHEKSIFPSFMV